MLADLVQDRDSSCANFTVVSVGTETDASILSPAVQNSVVGIKPTVGLISRRGIIPFTYSQDTAGPFARTVTDASILLGSLIGVDEKDVATHRSEGRAEHDYTKYLDVNGLNGAKIGVFNAHQKIITKMVSMMKSCLRKRSKYYVMKERQ